MPTPPHPQPMVITAPMVGHLCGDFGGRNKRGGPCGKPAILGTRRCDMHSGKPRAQARAEGNVAVELARWGLDGRTSLRDAGEVLLRLVSQSADRVELYSWLLGEAYRAAERVRAARAGSGTVARYDGAGGTAMDALDPVSDAEADIARVFATGGVASLIGYRYQADRDGGRFPAEEAIRGLVTLEADERDRCATFAAKAIAAGLAERQVRLAERQGALVVGLIRAVLGDLNLTPDQMVLAGQVVPARLRELDAAEVAA